MAQEQHALHPHPRTDVREKLKQNFLDKLLVGGTPAKRVITVHSITGMGKTWLGYLMFAQLTLPPGAMAVWASFEQTEDKPLPNVKPNTSIVRIPNNELLARLEAQPFRKRLNIAALDVLAKMFGERFVCHYRLAPDSNPDAPLLLFFDGLNDLINKEPEQPGSMSTPWEYAETQIFEPAAQRPNTLIFCFSHAPLLWHSYNLRELGDAVNLEAMTRTEVKELLGMHQLSGQIIEEFVYDVSQGHPWTMRYLLLEDPGLLRKQTISSHESSEEHGQESLSTSFIDALPPVAQDLIFELGVLRQVDVAPVEFLLRNRNVREVNGTVISRRLLRAVFAIYGDQKLLETSGSSKLSRLSALHRRKVKSLMSPESLEELLKIAASFYYGQIFSASTNYPENCLLAFVEWFYYSVATVAETRIDGIDLRPHIDDFRSKVGEVVEQLRAHLHVRFGVNVSRIELWNRAEISRDSETMVLLNNLGLVISGDGSIKVTHNPTNRLGEPLELKQYRRSTSHLILNRILDAYGLNQADLQPLQWIAQHQEDQSITLEWLREAYRQLGRPEPKSSLLRYYLSRYTAANIVRYDYERNVYYLNDWLRKVLRRWDSWLDDTTGVAQ